MNKKVMLTICVLLLAVLMGSAILFTETEVPVENAGTAQNAASAPDSLTFEGKELPIKKHLQTVLLIGTDSVEAYQQEEKLQDFYNFNQADVLMLLVLDKEANTAEIIQLNRDTMADVPWLDVLGNYGGTEYKQICLAYNYGDGGAKSCKNTVRAVSWLLFDAPIDHYIQLPMSGIGALNDLVGGVSVTIQEDLTVLDPAFVKGATVRLRGKQAETFLRVRMALEDDTNLSRMERHRAYLDSFQRCAREALNTDSEFTMKLVEVLAEHVQSDMTAQQMSSLVEQLDKTSVSPIRVPEGELLHGQEFYEFYVDEATLWELVKTVYCE